MSGTDGAPIWAAGGVLYRPGPDGPEVCLIHRSRYDDWSLPKGKLHRGEHPLAGAVREVAEETSQTGMPQARLPTISYRLANGAFKKVDYWLMRAIGGPEFAPNDEVDGLRWVTLAKAVDALSYSHDAEVVARAAELPAITSVVVLLRHGYAGERDTWTAPDRLRPLDERGWRQAHAVARLLPIFSPARLISAAPDRCRQSLEPLAEELRRPIEVDPAFDDTTPTSAAVAGLKGLLPSGGAVVISSQGKLIPRLVAALSNERPEDYPTRKGDGWLLSFANSTLAARSALHLDTVAPGAGAAATAQTGADSGRGAGSARYPIQ